MKKNSLLLFICLAYLSAYVFEGCRKEKIDEYEPDRPFQHIPESTTPSPVMTTSFIEDFNEYNLGNKGWVTNNSGTDFWRNGTANECDKDNYCYGFPAFSKTFDDYEYLAVFPPQHQPLGISSWLLSPVLSVKNGDKISFFTRTQVNNGFHDKLEVRMNNGTFNNVGGSVSTVGSFTTLLLSVNPNNNAGTYPSTWTKYEYTFNGITGTIETRLGFRYTVPAGKKAKNIGVDQFIFEKN
ncbi:MAG: choice-of-anchor J domain-containing protein [Chitinophagaceae bacterium]